MFGFIINIFDFLLYKPMFNLLVVLYQQIPGHDFGIAVILLTLIIRFLLYPLANKAVKSQAALQKLQPKMKEIQEMYKADKERQAKEMLNLYKTENINPFSGLFLAMIQLPVLIALYRVFWMGLKQEELKNLYWFVANPGQINANFLNIADLSKPNYILAVAAGVLQFFQTKMLTPKKEKNAQKENDFASAMQTQMLYFFPVMTIIILLKLPSALGLYWTVSGLFSIIQQYLVLKKNKKND